MGGIALGRTSGEFCGTADGVNVRRERHVLREPVHRTRHDGEGLVISFEIGQRNAVGPEGHEEHEVHAGFQNGSFAQVHEVRDWNTDTRLFEQFASSGSGEGLAALDEPTGQAPVADLRRDGALHEYYGRTDTQDGNGHWLGRIPVFVAVDALVRRSACRKWFGAVLAVEGSFCGWKKERESTGVGSTHESPLN